MTHARSTHAQVSSNRLIVVCKSARLTLSPTDYHQSAHLSWSVNSNNATSHFQEWHRAPSYHIITMGNVLPYCLWRPWEKDLPCQTRTSRNTSSHTQQSLVTMRDFSCFKGPERRNTHRIGDRSSWPHQTQRNCARIIHSHPSAANTVEPQGHTGRSSLPHPVWRARLGSWLICEVWHVGCRVCWCDGDARAAVVAQTRECWFRVVPSMTVYGPVQECLDKNQCLFKRTSIMTVQQARPPPYTLNIRGRPAHT